MVPVVVQCLGGSRFTTMVEHEKSFITSGPVQVCARLGIKHKLEYSYIFARKANNTRAFLQQCPRKTKELCYKILVLPITEYACVIWDLLIEDNIRKLEMMQCRAAHMVYRKNSKYWDMYV